MKYLGTRLIVATAIILLGGCGTTSNFKPSEQIDADLTSYSAVYVADFTNETSVKKKSEKAATEYALQVGNATRAFADKIAAQLTTTGVFETVSRTPLETKSLTVSGAITRYAEGNAAARVLIGLGAGSSYFDATVSISDESSGTQLGSFGVDKNSWALGGGLAAGQTVEHFMNGAAKKVASALVCEAVAKTDSSNAETAAIIEEYKC